MPDHAVPRASLVSCETELCALLPEWTRLWQRAPDAAPFQSPAWLMAWWRHFATGPLYILTAHARGELVGVLPLYRRDEPGIRKLLPLGIGVSDYIDALADPAYPGLAGVLLAATLDIPEWQELSLPDLPPHSALVDAACPSGLAETRNPGPVCPVLALPRDNDLSAVISANTARYLRHAHQRVQAAGGVAIELAPREEIGAAMNDLFRLHAARWQERGEDGVCANPAVQAFHREAAQALCEQGMLRLWRLRIAGELAAVYYGLHWRDRAYAYLGGFSPEFARLRPGALIMRHALETAQAEEAREFHFLRGGEAYKYGWGAVDRCSVNRTFTQD
jgi:CelD/BcsL family acetyltransferase involved in cellulose biosynthesis